SRRTRLSPSACHPAAARSRRRRLPARCVARRRGRAYQARSSGRLSLGGQADGGEDLLVPGASAQVSGQRLPGLGVRRLLDPVKQVVCGYDEAGRAEAALNGAGLDERLLDGVERSTVGQAFHGPDIAPLGLPGGDQARAHRQAVQVDGTRATLALLTRVLRTR